MDKIAEIYTDGSCHTQLKIGGWAAIVFYQGDKIILTDKAFETTHNRMELNAVIQAIMYFKATPDKPEKIIIYSDSQYVIRLRERMGRLRSTHFTTSRGNAIQNTDLIKKLYELIESINIEFVKVKAHQKKSVKVNYNREVDKLSRKIVRDYSQDNNLSTN